MKKVYLISTIEDKRRYKIGYTRRDVNQRLREFKTGNSIELEILNVFNSKWGSKIEANLKRKYESKRIDGEWFFLTQEEVDSFNNQCQDIHNIFELLNNNNTWIIDKGGINNI